jgi:putative transport protein
MIKDLNLQHKFHATITRISRGDVEFVPTAETVIELGDRIRIVASKENIDKVTKYFGDSIKAVSETDFLSLSLGIVIGVFIGMIPIPLSNGLTFKLGFAGGPLIAGLILGKLERTGPINWGLPFNANLVLRQVGLVFFLAAIGTKAGAGLGATFKEGGLAIILAGAIITSAATIMTVFIGQKYFKMPMAAIMGMMSGIQTQPACLAYANQHSESELPNVWYATVYPAAMVAKIILAQIIVSTILIL